MIRRRLFAAASAISLLLCAASVGLWVRSYWVADEIEVDPPRGYGCIMSSRGLLLLWRDLEPSAEGGAWRWSYPSSGRVIKIRDFVQDLAYPPPKPESFGFYFASSATGLCIIIPEWFVAFMSGVLVFGLVVVGRRRNHSRESCCRCGYDLTGNVSGTCPECGTRVPKNPTTKAPRERAAPTAPPSLRFPVE